MIQKLNLNSQCSKMYFKSHSEKQIDDREAFFDIECLLYIDAGAF